MLQQIRVLDLQVQVHLNLIIVPPSLQIVDETSVLLDQVQLIEKLTQAEGADEETYDARGCRYHTINQELTCNVTLAIYSRCVIEDAQQAIHAKGDS